MIDADFLRLAAVSSTGSGRGMSFWSMAAACGKRAVLTEERDEERKLSADAVPYDPLKKYALVVGGVYHKLHELWRQDKLDDWDLAALSADDASVFYGAQLFDAYRAQWEVDLWGMPLSIEETLTAHVASHVVNAKCDLVVRIGERDLPRVQAYCPEVRHAGNYIVDFKTEGRQYDPIYYTGGLQALWYPLAWNTVHPEAPVEGIIFDCIRKPASKFCIDRSNFRAIFAPSHLSQEEELHGLIIQGAANIQRAKSQGLGNRSECVRFGFGGADVCPFYGERCDGAG